VDEWDDEDFNWEEKNVKPEYASPCIVYRAILGSAERCSVILGSSLEQESKMFKVNSCFICKNPLNEACITCQCNQEANNQSQCKKVVGICNHCFHTQ
jgi:hypothetical protein